MPMFRLLPLIAALLLAGKVLPATAAEQAATAADSYDLPRCPDDGAARSLASPVDPGVSDSDAIEVITDDFGAESDTLTTTRTQVRQGKRRLSADKVTVNAEDAGLRANRLRLLNDIREATRTVADFSRIEG